jgi:hypothetical protein
MAFRMSSLTRTKSGAYRARIGIPADVRDDYQALYGKRWEELFHRPASLPLSKAKVDHSEWVAEIESRLETLRARQRGEGHDLTERQARALAGEWYRSFVRQHEENPGDPDGWLAYQWAVTDEIEAAVGDDPSQIDFGAPMVRRKIRPIIADKAETAQFLASKGVPRLGAFGIFEHRSPIIPRAYAIPSRHQLG